MSSLLNALKIAGISIAVALLGGLVQALTNFHPTDQVTSFIMTVIGGSVIAGINELIHKLQGTVVAKASDVVTK